MAEQPLLAVNSTGKPTKAAVGSDDPVAWNDHWNGVLAVGIGYGSGCSGRANRTSQLGVGPRTAHRNGTQRRPNGPLECGARWVDRESSKGMDVALDIGEQVVRDSR